MATPAVEVVDLVKKYNGREAVLNGVTFAIQRGEFVTLFGRSGCGKTTLLNIIGGLDRPTSGDVRIEGLSTIGMSEDHLAKMRMKKLGFVFQDYNLLNDLTVRENAELPLRLSRRPNPKKVAEVLSVFGLGQIQNASPNTLSGGEAQRVAVARALMNDPKIILADEPTGNLDSQNSEVVIRTLDLACEKFGAAVILATHNEELVHRRTKAIRLEDGRTEIISAD